LRVKSVKNQVKILKFAKKHFENFNIFLVGFQKNLRNFSFFKILNDENNATSFKFELFWRI